MKFLKTILLIFMCSLQTLWAIDQRVYVSSQSGLDRFPLVSSNKAAPLVISSMDYKGVKTIARHLRSDIERVTGVAPQIILDSSPSDKNIVLIGTIGKNPLIDKLIASGKLDVNGIAGRWDTFFLETIRDPFPGVDQALVIVGSNKRGTFYGMFDLSAQIGVSPWNWWADVPVQKKDELYVLPGRHSAGEPAVKYRGIFLNDEEPSLGRWAVENYGGFTSGFYEKLFELMLRLKANYLWPAMWWASFNSDDPKNPELADEYGIVMGTTHHEPMNRAHAEWRNAGKGDWNYEINADVLREFWRQGIKRMGNYETIVTLAMRGNGDEAMTEDTNIALLEKIVADQRQIIAEATDKDITKTPQVWALYKEVQDYYDKGMRVPDDVTLLLCDDNWGNIRKLPQLTDNPRSGGYGIYYHFDYVGAPRNYKWLNTNQIERTWEQMHLAYEYGVDRIWLVNVGDLKPMEFPIEFFLDYAWNPNNWPAVRLPEYSRLWAERQFGAENAVAIAGLLDGYTKFNSCRKPELLSPESYSLVHYREFERVVEEYNQLAEKAEHLYETIPAEYKDAFYQLVLYPVKASANLNELFLTVAQNRLYAKQGRALTNDLAEKAQQLFDKDSTMSHYFNKVLADGKWNNMMNQTHISYTNWQQPEKDVLPKVERINLGDKAEMGVAIEGSDQWWPCAEDKAILPEFDSINRQSFYLDVFNRGSKLFDFKIKSKSSWLKFSETTGTIDKQKRIWVSVDWQNVSAGQHEAPITIRGAKKKVVVYAIINNRFDKKSVLGFVECNGYVSMEAHHFSRKVDVAPIRWQLIPNLGRTGSAVTPTPVTSQPENPGNMCPRLEYDLFLTNGGDVDVHVYISPTLNFHNNQGLRFAVSIDDEEPKIINIHKDDVKASWQYADWWMQSVADNIKVMQSIHKSIKPGQHTLKIWMVDPGIVFQKIVIDTGGLKPSYLGPPESVYIVK